MNRFDGFDRLVWIITLALWLGICLTLAFVLSGCMPNHDDPMYRPPTIIPIEKIKIVHQMNWVATLSIVAIALSVMGFIGGNKYAIPIFVGSCVGLGMSLAVMKYAGLIAIGTLIAAGAVCVYAIIVKTRALKEVVGGVQWVKDMCVPKVERLAANRVLAARQSDATKKLVKKIKNGN